MNILTGLSDLSIILAIFTLIRHIFTEKFMIAPIFLFILSYLILRINVYLKDLDI